jgi:hypothetical protein
MSLSLIPLLLATAAAQAAPQPADPLDKVRCIREDVTGSLVSKRKVCHTEREWRLIRGNAESEARRITQPGNLNDLNH